MAQYDLILMQNVSAGGTEFSQIAVNIAKGGLLSSNSSNVPTVLPAGTNGYILELDSNEVTGLKWSPKPTSHTQNTDVSTTSNTFQLGSGSYKVSIVAESASKMSVKVDGLATYSDFQAKDATFDNVSVSNAPTLGAHLTNKTYVDGLFAANDAMIYKGTIGTGGTITIATFNALTTYNAGWTYRVIEAGTIRGKVCEIGDLVTVIVDRTGSGNLDSDFTVVQNNLDGAVIGPSSTTDGHVALFDGATGKLIKSGGALGTMAFETATNYVTKATYDANSILYATADNTPLALTVNASTVVGRKSSGDIVALVHHEIMNILWQTAPATKTSTGTAGSVAKDDNYLYICTATNTWKRVALATNW
jgi:hypothetical protein